MSDYNIGDELGVSFNQPSERTFLKISKPNIYIVFKFAEPDCKLFDKVRSELSKALGKTVVYAFVSWFKSSTLSHEAIESKMAPAKNIVFTIFILFVFRIELSC